MAIEADLILVLDAGTTSTRAMVFDPAGRLKAQAQRELAQHYPHPGWVEHDASEIWTSTLNCAREVVAACGVDNIACTGITNQRETVVAWDRKSGEPLVRAIVWQDRRTQAQCEALREAGAEPLVQQRTGLVLDPYFSATKMRYLLDNVPDVADAARTGRLAFGTVESWLAFRLTGGAHISDASNASRTSLLALDGTTWDRELCDLFGVPVDALPQVVDSAGLLGTLQPEHLGAALPLTGLIGDQQSAAIGLGCLSPGDSKATYGTGAFMLTNMGKALPRSGHRLLGTVLHQIGGRRTFAIEGSVFVAGSLVQWLRDNLGVIERANETEALARAVPDNGGVVIVPALSGLGAPHWRPDARAMISGLTFSANRGHIARAALESMAHQTHDLAAAFAGDGASWTRLRIDGGMSANDWMAQDIADILQLRVERPHFVETTALGAAMLAAVGVGLHPTLGAAVHEMRGPVRDFSPAMSGEVRDARLAGWRAAIASI